jgi:hypothetical protein
MKTKAIFLIIVLLFISLYTFGDNEEPEEDGKKLISFDLLVGVRYNNIIDAEEFLLTDMRAGGSLDLIFNINNNIGIGADVGLYAMYDIDNFMILYDLPINALVKLSMGKVFALEAYGGLYFTGFKLDEFYTEMLYSIGGRLVLSKFYVEGNYIFTDPDNTETGSLVVGAGVIMDF